MTCVLQCSYFGYFVSCSLQCNITTLAACQLLSSNHKGAPPIPFSFHLKELHVPIFSLKHSKNNYNYLLCVEITVLTLCQTHECVVLQRYLLKLHANQLALAVPVSQYYFVPQEAIVSHCSVQGAVSPTWEDKAVTLPYIQTCPKTYVRDCAFPCLLR